MAVTEGWDGTRPKDMPRTRWYEWLGARRVRAQQAHFLRSLLEGFVELELGTDVRVRPWWDAEKATEGRVDSFCMNPDGSMTVTVVPIK